MKVNLYDIGDEIKLVTDFVSSDSIINEDGMQLELHKYQYANPNMDYEKTVFHPINTSSIDYRLLKKNGDTLYFSDLGFTNDDIVFQKNAFVRSFLNIDVFDSDVVTNQRIVANFRLQFQLGPEQRDINGELLDVSLSPCTIKVMSPLVYKDIAVNGQSFLMPYFKSLYGFPLSLYGVFSVLNAKDGKRYDFTQEPSYGVNEKIEKTHLKYDLYRIGNKHYYTIEPTVSLYAY